MLDKKRHYRLFQPTGDNLSIFGFGTVKIGRNFKVKNKTPDGFPLIGDAELDQILNLSLDLGVNLIDTAPAYGIAEERLGQWLKKNPGKFFVSTKVGEDFDGENSTYDFSPKAVEASVLRSLKRLQLDVIDCMLVHCSRNDYTNLTESDIFTTLSGLKKRGMIRSFGASIYSEEAARLTLKEADAIMVTYNPKERELQHLITEAHNLGKGVFIKKALLQGHIHDLGQHIETNEPTLRDCLRLGEDTVGVTSMIIGTTNPEHLRQNIEALSRVSPLVCASSRRIPKPVAISRG